MVRMNLYEQGHAYPVVISCLGLGLADSSPSVFNPQLEACHFEDGVCALRRGGCRTGNLECSGHVFT